MDLELVPEDDEKGQDDATDEPQAEATPVYDGPERRKQQRRQEVDRREMMRFEAKSGRRSGKDRRKPIGLWKDRDF